MGEDVRPVHRYHADDPWAAESGVWVYYKDHAAVVAALEAEVEFLRGVILKAEASHDRQVELIRAARAEVERLKALLMHARGYVEGPHYTEHGEEIGADWDDDDEESPCVVLLREIDAALRETENTEESGSVATDAGRAIPTPASPGSSPSPTDAVVEAAVARVFDAIGVLDLPADSDCLAVALATYYSDHPGRPDPDPDDEEEEA